MKKEGFQNEEKREEVFKELIKELYEEVYDWTISEVEELWNIWAPQLEEAKMPQSVIGWCRKLIEVICEVKREKLQEGVSHE